MQTAAWTELSLYESHDLVRKQFQEKHDRELSATKAQEIVSHVAQGREYFLSARSSGLLVRPLLLYYGAVSLARALTLFLSPTLRECALKPSHGLSAMGWGEQLATGTSGLPSVQIGFNVSGTLSELVAVTKNTEHALIGRAPYPTTFLFESRGSSPLPPEFTVTLREVLARVPKLAELYEQTFDELPATYRAHVFMLNESTQTDVAVFGSFRRMPPQELLRRRFQLPADVPLAVRQTHQWLGEANVSFRMKHASLDELATKLPPVWDGDLSTSWLVSPFDSGVRLSSLVTYFVLSYVTGMIVRYHPTQWQALIARQRGDFLFPMLQEAIRVIEDEFPSRVASEFMLGGIAG
jgi:hypothetical protein